MAWPNKKHFAAQRELFMDGGGPDMVREYIQAGPSIGKRCDDGSPWPQFHRCHLCGEHPEVMGDRAVMFGRQHEKHLCEYCVKQIYEAVMAVEVSDALDP